MREEEAAVALAKNVNAKKEVSQRQKEKQQKVSAAERCEAGSRRAAA